MAVAIALWSVQVQPGKKTKFSPMGDLRVTNASLGEKIQDESARTCIKFTYEKPQTVEDTEPVPEKISTILCALTPGKIEQATLDVILEGGEEYVLENTGKNSIYLTGNYIDQTGPSGFGDDSDFSDEDEEDFDLRDVSSDVEIDPNELEIPSDDDADRFEEVADDADTSKTLKRPADSDAMDVEAEGGDKSGEKKKKKKNKKQKGEDGKPVVVAGDASESSPAKTNGAEKKKEDATAKKADSGSMKELGGGLKVKDVVVGKGGAAKSGDTLSMRYIGKLENGKVFDSNTKGKPFTFHLGKGEVIKGWDQGLVGMQVGGERLIVIPPKLAYGNKKQADIPAGSTLKFECKLLEIK